jgi:hypothetical protein
MAAATVVDQPDLGVEAFEFAVGQAQLDRGQDLVTDAEQHVAGAAQPVQRLLLSRKPRRSTSRTGSAAAAPGAAASPRCRSG